MFGFKSLVAQFLENNKLTQNISLKGTHTKKKKQAQCHDCRKPRLSSKNVEIHMDFDFFYCTKREITKTE